MPEEASGKPEGRHGIVIDLEDDWTDTETANGAGENKSTEDNEAYTNGRVEELKSPQDDEKLSSKDAATEDFEFDFQTIDEAEQTEHILKVRVHANFCMRCGAGFVQQKKLNNHLEKNECSADKNSIEMSFTCSICGQGFFGNICLRHHLMRHAQTKPFKCKKCNKSFITVRSLYKHYHTHKGYRPFICDLCPKAFHSAKKLSEHHKEHAGKRPYACTICSKRFNVAKRLAKHKRNHATKKPFKCKFCKRNYAQNSVRNLHMRTHTKTKRPMFQFLCEVCGLIHVRSWSTFINDLPTDMRKFSYDNVLSLSEEEDMPFSVRVTRKRVKKPQIRRPVVEIPRRYSSSSSSSGSSVEIVEDPLQFTILVDD